LTMILKIQKVLRFTIFSGLGFGLAGLVLGFMHTSEDAWMWLLGFGLIGAFAGGLLAFATGKTGMLFKLILAGAAVGALSQYLISTSEFEPWLQMTIMGVLFGAFFGMAISLFDSEKKKKPEKTYECEECGQKIGKNDRFCAGCGTEFE